MVRDQVSMWQAVLPAELQLTSSAAHGCRSHFLNGHVRPARQKPQSAPCELSRHVTIHQMSVDTRVTICAHLGDARNETHARD
jgi:hypothetical protein